MGFEIVLGHIATVVGMIMFINDFLAEDKLGNKEYVGGKVCKR